MAEERSVRGWPLLWALFFLVGICLPLVDEMTGFDPTPASTENRFLAELPALPRGRAAVQEFPSRFEAYHRDHFGLRNTLLRWNRRLRLRLLGVSPVDKVMIGHDGWLFLTSNQALDYQRAAPFSAADLELWAQALTEQQRRLASRGILFLFVLAPNKHSLYPEVLPPRGRAVWTSSRADQLLEHLRRQTDLEVVDLRTILAAAKAQERVFYKLDTHWNDYGNYLAYQAVIERLAERLPRVGPPSPIADYERRQRRVSTGDLARMLGLEGEVYEMSVFLHPRRRRPRVKKAPAPTIDTAVAYQRSGNGVRALMVGDSFGIRMLPRMAEHFARLVYIPGQHVPGAILDDERPDVVILELVERHLAATRLPRVMLHALRVEARTKEQTTSAPGRIARGHDRLGTPKS